ncbi:MAG TPA: molybdopterin-dependent oxidoreductase [Nitrososphaerales archaeon]|nr:molybdopterin-dependent oxidoreductase [Nitrososphaerales archaeon]HUK75599.1 molybdopterin-dependent oxidoreductase [Nitrososphaerales archaeon]
MRPRLRRFLMGVGAGAVALLVSLVIRLFFGGVFLPEIAVGALVTNTPGTVESVLVTNLQYVAKYSALTGAIIVNLVLYGVIAYLLSGVSGRKEYGDRVGIYTFSAYGVTFILTIVALAFTQVLSSPQPLPTIVLTILPPQLAFGVVLVAGEKFAPAQTGVLCEPLKPLESKGARKRKFDRKRRLVIQAGVATAVAAALLYYGVGLLFPKPGVSRADAVTALYQQEVTPTDQFYRVDVNIFPPSVSTDGWTLPVTGMVSNPLTLDYNQLLAMDSVEQYNTLECVSNDVGGDLISTAKWTGVKLKDVLSQAQVSPEATYVVFKAADGYDVGIPMAKALLDGTILAYQINGQPLPAEHGYPIRMIVPGYYGMMNCKWVTSIELVNETHQGYWQVRGWANEASYQTGSSIVTPGAAQVDDRFGIAGSTSVPVGLVPVAGVAFAGDRGISKVEVSTDGGNTWIPASVKDPLSQYTWVLWTADWNPTSTGNYSIAVRATDGTGAVQTAVMNTPFPSGATGYHIVDVGVTSS